jgi:hypothetical protein
MTRRQKVRGGRPEGNRAGRFLYRADSQVAGSLPGGSRRLLSRNLAAGQQRDQRHDGVTQSTNQMIHTLNLLPK